MKISPLKTTDDIEIDGPLVISPNIFEDSRGFFYESWNKETFFKLTNVKLDFVQDNHSKSSNGVLRGLHYQLNPYPQGKLVRCIKGSIFDNDLYIKELEIKKVSKNILICINWPHEYETKKFLNSIKLFSIKYKVNYLVIV